MTHRQKADAIIEFCAEATINTSGVGAAIADYVEAAGVKVVRVK